MENKKANGNIGNLFSLIFAVIIFVIGWYIFLPAFNLQSVGLWIFMIIIFAFLFITVSASEFISSKAKSKTINKKLLSVLGIIIALIILLFIVAIFSGSKIFRAKEYAVMINDNIRKDSIDNYKATLDNVPLLDRDSAVQLSNRELGSLIDVVSQFELGDNEQVTITGNPVRVSPLFYGGFFKWLNNNENGTPGYIKLNMKTQDAELIRVEGGIKYSPSERFSRDIKRYLRFNYPTYIFDTIKFEVNEEGHPYWIAPEIKYTIGAFGGKDIISIVTVNAVTGELNEYKKEEIPEWVDNVYSSELIMEQYDNYGAFQSGFLNSKFGQKGVTATTEGYNYIPQGNDNWIYTGITSAGRDESNIGFILANKRTKEIIYYPLSGAEEYSAMSSAEGVVQHLGYTATFPLLLKVNNQPTYVMALKDAGQLVKMYGMVNVAKYQIVATGDTVDATEVKYAQLLKNNGVNDTTETTSSVKGKIVDIKTAVKEGTTYFYIKLEGKDIYYSINIVDSEEAILLKAEDEIELQIIDVESKIIPAVIK
ncbi:MAG: hypothetical protein K0Q97_2658 [Bacillota bacterium]|nr:hypothetical protein [Bacillota bacterium]